MCTTATLKRLYKSSTHPTVHNTSCYLSQMSSWTTSQQQPQGCSVSVPKQRVKSCFSLEFCFQQAVFCLNLMMMISSNVMERFLINMLYAFSTWIRDGCTSSPNMWWWFWITSSAWMPWAALKIAWTILRRYNLLFN